MIYDSKEKRNSSTYRIWRRWKHQGKQTARLFEKLILELASKSKHIAFVDSAEASEELELRMRQFFRIQSRQAQSNLFLQIES